MAKKKKTTSKKTEVKSENPVKEITLEQRKESVDKLKQLKEGNVVTIPSDAVVNIPISGSFRKAIEGVLYYIMEPLTANQIIISMSKVKTNFEGLKPDQVNNTDRAIWCIMSLLSELHFQAAQQGKTVETDEKIDESISSMIAGLDGATEEFAKRAEKLNNKITKSKPGELKLKKDKS
tara:strand:- start:2348 stop:2881 length:534 start_codon:yes stop_codon:yes gene_type:complete